MESEEYSEEEVFEVPRAGANGDTDKSIILPEKSKHRYAQVYENFTNWQTEKLKPSLTETVVLEFFKELASSKSPATLWSFYSMLRAMLSLKHGLDISNYTNLKDFIKSKNQGYNPPKPKLFTDEQVNKFIEEAPDHLYLATKVALIFSLVGGCKTDELVDMSLDQIETHGRVYLVKIPNLGTNTHRCFTICDRYFEIVEQYRNLRPPNMPSNRFFTNYQKGKCTVQFIGKNKFTRMPKQIAEYLKLEEPDRYTGHSVRSSTTTYSSTVQKPRLRIPRTTAAAGISIPRSRIRKKENTRSSKIKAKTLIKSVIDEMTDYSNSESNSSLNLEMLNSEPDSPAVIMEDSESISGSETSAADQAKLNSSSSVNVDNNIHYEEDNRIDLVDKYFSFENCTNVHITFYSK